MNRVPAATIARLYRIVHVLLVNKFLDYLVRLETPFSSSLIQPCFWLQILAFYYLFVRMIKHISSNYRRRRLHGDGHRHIDCNFDLMADENSVYPRHALLTHH